ncbi:MAG: trigger factor [Lachnospiraceae bacterium]|nr:trigger factor [Lachnospiraceae bacterium]
MNRKWMLCLAAATSVLLTACGVESDLSKTKTEDYVELGQYKGLEVSVERPEVTDEYTDNYINYVLTQNAELKEVTGRAAQNGDTLNIDYVGEKDGVAFDGGTGTKDLLLGSHTFIAGFEDGLIGKNKGDKVDLNLTFPDNYPKAELAGQDVVFHVTINMIQESVIPELTDETVKKIQPDCDNVEDYKAFVKNLLTEDAEKYYDQQLSSKLIEAAKVGATFKNDPADTLVEVYYQKALKNMSNFAAQYGMTTEQMVSQYYGVTMEEFEKKGREGAKESAQEALLMQAIANAEKIDVSKDEINEMIKKEIDNGDFASEEELRKSLGDEDIRDYVMAEKVMNVLKENAVITEESEGESNGTD